MQMVKPEFSAGNENKFNDFIGKLDGRERVALISHTDLDGIISAKVVNKAIDINFMKFVGYQELDKRLVDELKAEKVKKVIFTDISINEPQFVKEIEKFADVLIIDHHTFPFDLNSPNTVYINSQGYCTAYLCYYLFSKMHKLETMDWLVACASISDWMFVKNAPWLTEIYKKYGDSFILDENKIKKGKFWELQYILSLVIIYFKDNLNIAYDFIPDEIDKVDVLSVYAKKVKEEIEQQSKLFEKNKEKINDVYFWICNPKYNVREIIINKESSNEKNMTYIFAQRKGKYFYISARRQDKAVNLPEFLKKLIIGFQEASAGGHIPAAGGHILSKDLDEFVDRMKKR